MIPPFVSSQVTQGRYLFSPFKDNSSPPPLRILCAGFEECSPDYEIHREGFHCAAVEIIAGGEWELVSKYGKWRLHAGMIFTYGPGVDYSLSGRSRHGLLKYFVDFEGEEALQVLRRANLKPGVPARLAHPRWSQDLIEQLIDTARMQYRQREIMGRMLAELLIARLRTDRHIGGKRIPASFQSFERCREYLAAHYLKIHDFALAARFCGVSQVHLCRLFRKYAGQTPQEFVTRMKMNHAAELIMRGSMPVKAAAFEVGYADPCHFSKLFKKVHGISPSFFPERRI